MKNNIQIRTLRVGQLQTNCYLVSEINTGKTIIIDPGDDPDYISQTLSDNKLKLCLIIATHGHFDHVMGAWQIQQIFNIPFGLHEKDRFLLKSMKSSAQYFLKQKIIDQEPVLNYPINPGKFINLGNIKLEIIYTPGHTPGGISLYDKINHYLFAGDTIFSDGGVGRTDFAYSSEKLLNKSIKLILSYPKTTKLFCGHGNETSVDKELKFYE